MFCPECGGDLREGMLFCPYCGCMISTHKNNAPEAISPADAVSEKSVFQQTSSPIEGELAGNANSIPKKEKKRIGPIILGITIVLLIVGAVCFAALGPFSEERSCEELVDEIFDDYINARDTDQEVFADLFPDELIDLVAENWNLPEEEKRLIGGECFEGIYIFSYQEAEDALNVELDHDPVSVEYTLTSESTVKKKKFEEVAERCSDYLGIEIKDMKYLTVDAKLEFRYEDSDKTVFYDKTYLLPVIKLDRKWYLFGYDRHDFSEELETLSK